MHKINMFHRTGVLTTVGFENSGADWLEQYKKYIGEPNVIVVPIKYMVLNQMIWPYN
jgi:hypothetical protein